MPTPNFAIPGLMALTRPILDAQRLAVDLPPKRIQDSLWLGLPSVGPITPGGAAPTWPLALVEMVFGCHYPIGDDITFKLSTEPSDGDGTVTPGADPATWEFSILPQPLPLPMGLHYWEIRTTDSQGTITVYYTGTQSVSA